MNVQELLLYSNQITRFAAQQRPQEALTAGGSSRPHPLHSNHRNRKDAADRGRDRARARGAAHFPTHAMSSRPFRPRRRRSALGAYRQGRGAEEGGGAVDGLKNQELSTGDWEPAQDAGSRFFRYNMEAQILNKGTA